MAPRWPRAARSSLHPAPLVRQTAAYRARWRHAAPRVARTSRPNSTTSGSAYAASTRPRCWRREAQLEEHGGRGDEGVLLREEGRQNKGNAGQASTPVPRRSTIRRPVSDRRIAIASTRASAAQLVTNCGHQHRTVKARAEARSRRMKSRVSSSARRPSMATNASRRGRRAKGPAPLRQRHEGDRSPEGGRRRRTDSRRGWKSSCPARPGAGPWRACTPSP